MHSKTKDNNNKKPRLTGGVCSAYSEVALAEYSSGSSRRFDAAASHFHRQTRMIENSAAGNFVGNSAPEEMQTTAWESSVDRNDSTNVIRLSQQRRPVIISPDAAAAAAEATAAAASLAVRSNASRPACPRCLAGEPARI